jgi:5-oxoprolinase (ATP-hydrolysing)
MAGWQFWIDRGGTFTDVIGRAPDGSLHVRKVPTAAAGTADDAGIAAARAVLDAAGGHAPRVSQVRIGTTIATNALLERRGARVALVTTRGFGDALGIGYQARPDVFARHIVKPPPLHEHVIEVDERMGVDGSVVRPLDLEALRAALVDAHRRGIEAVGIAFVHGWQHAAHEAAAARLARELGFRSVIVSHERSPLVRFIARADTVVFEAYLAGVLDGFVNALAAAVRSLDPDARLTLMQSSGGLVAPGDFHAVGSVLSGPAGGLTAVARFGARLGLTHLVAFDMGGTSTDVSVFDGEVPRRYEHELAGVRLQAPLLDIHSTAAGGGSVVRLEDGRLQVGPGSAGALPGPAAYGRGGPPTLTDVQVVLGRLRPAFLPSAFGPRSDAPIDARAARDSLVTLDPHADPVATAAAALDVGVEAMANAVLEVLARSGHDPARFTLFCFGGAGPQHACRVADACGIPRILVHPLASVLSAFGIGVADELTVARRSLGVALDAAGLRTARAVVDELDPGDPSRETTRIAEVRAGESETTLDVPLGALPEMIEAFAERHRRRYGFTPEDPLTIATVRLELRRSPPWPDVVPAAIAPHRMLPETVEAWFDGWIRTPVRALQSLDMPMEGPSLLVDPTFTLVVERGWCARPQGGAVLLTRAGRAGQSTAPRAAGAARLEIFNNLFMHVATQMGAVLRDTAQSINIKERLDYSCALFDAAGCLVANAPHMPVHLGSMGASVRAVIAATGGRFVPGEAFLLNSPYCGGTHLPDMTVVTPLFAGADCERPCAFVASRAHHADIGGITPGSMPAFSTHIDEEGVLIDVERIVEHGRLREAFVRGRLAAGRWPARSPDQNVADLRAQLAANARGASEFARAVERHGATEVQDALGDVQANAEACLRGVIGRLRSGRFRYELDDGPVIEVAIDIDRAARRARVDFTGTSAQGPHNFNAPRAVTVAAVIYVFRTLIDRPIPLNEGCLVPLELVIPPGCMLDPSPPAAVVAGNVETSQCIVDALYGALGVLAASQGTMNNLTFGDANVQYYETIAGGAGAGDGFAGASCVQTHMTNSRLTDPEILETRFPVRLRRYAIRHGSGGAGRWRGGDGALREIEFLAPMSGALLANHRRIAPFGIAGGSAAATGTTRLLRADGRIETLPACARFEVGAGDAIEIATPGGGGFGAVEPEAPS